MCVYLLSESVCISSQWECVYNIHCISSALVYCTSLLLCLLLTTWKMTVDNRGVLFSSIFWMIIKIWDYIYNHLIFWYFRDEGKYSLDRRNMLTCNFLPLFNLTDSLMKRPFFSSAKNWNKNKFVNWFFWDMCHILIENLGWQLVFQACYCLKPKKGWEIPKKLIQALGSHRLCCCIFCVL